MIGQRINDRYEVIRTIGDGGMAVVYEARDIILERPVAVKVLQPHYKGDSDFVRRFHREALSSTNLIHSNIVDIYDVGEADGVDFIVMEYIEGETLKEYINRVGVLSLDDVIRIFHQVGSAIAYAHSQQVIHRDIKPHNILLNQNQEAKVADFGIARASTEATMTHTKSVLGTVHYLSPEQARGGMVTTASDIYALGIVLFEMVTGELPFHADSAVSIAIKHLQEPLPDPSNFRENIPQSLKNAIYKATAKDPDQRHESVEAMVRDVDTTLDPDRYEEAPLVLEQEDNEQTKAVPIVGGVEYPDEETQIAGADIKEEETLAGPLPNEEANSNEERPIKKKKKKKNWVLILFLIGLLFFGAIVAAFTLIPALFSVDDVDVPEVAGLHIEDAEEQLEEQGLISEIEWIEDEEIEEDYVIRQNPNPGRTVKEGSTVNLHVSEGPENVDMPGVMGMQREQAEETLADFEEVSFEAEESTEAEENTIISQDPDEGERVVYEDEIHLVYSSLPEFSLDNLQDQSEENVRNYLQSQGLTGTFNEAHSESVAEGDVIQHEPGPYETVEYGDEVQFVISLGPEEEEEEEVVEEEEPEEPESQQVEAVLPVEISEEEQDEGIEYEVLIVYEDATTDEPSVFVEETIEESETYHIPLEITPEIDGTYTLYIDDEEVQSNTFPYEE
ncbi:Stk1 family PASTA domain-containing Ser/Thr kinase [Salsuginibacillus kocurii]|uniref:Stk1 family PASTA domain-containing Ser/Thr kinase n=1 Tax=Salsuginibacillus kocurii TaxID=427078 RepID=UPI00036E638B|nr:Stk1 family PASTA domain-containing Ser/Thr kinase [Salsuginibacillus kocurii]